MYCKNCGKLLDDNAVICPSCGVATDNFYKNAPAGRAPSPNRPAETATSYTGFTVLGFFFPIVGLILYLVWMDTLPLKAKACGKGALIGVIVSVGLSLIAVVFYFILFAILFAGAGMD